MISCWAATKSRITFKLLLAAWKSTSPRLISSKMDTCTGIMQQQGQQQGQQQQEKK
jgi:hypothetical protein